MAARWDPVLHQGSKSVMNKRQFQQYAPLVDGAVRGTARRYRYKGGAGKAVCGVLLILLGLLPSVAHGQDKPRFVPSPVPVNIKPLAHDESRWGVGYNQMHITSEWTDEFFTFDTERVGELEYDVYNLALGIQHARSDVSYMEYDLLLGKVDSREKTKRYHSDIIDRDVNVGQSGDGYDAGIRFLWSRNLFRQHRQSGGKLIDWNAALSLHAALYYMDGTYEALSTDGQFGNTYDAEEAGIFLRPIVALQPIVYVTDRITLVPFIGVGTKAVAEYIWWEDTKVIWNGVDEPGQRGDGEEVEVDITGLEGQLGFDIGFVTNRAKKQELTFGGLVSKLYGGDDADFYELHILYTFPFR
jgi:hypothetical protein